MALDPNNEEAEFSSFSGLASQLATDRTINDVENIQTKLILLDLKCRPHFTSILFFPGWLPLKEENVKCSACYCGIDICERLTAVGDG